MPEPVTIRQHMEGCHALDPGHPEVPVEVMLAVHRNDHMMELTGFGLGRPHAHVVPLVEEVDE